MLVSVFAAISLIILSITALALECQAQTFRKLYNKEKSFANALLLARELQRELYHARGIRLMKLAREARKFYLATGGYVLCKTAEEVIEKRKAAAEHIAELERKLKEESRESRCIHREERCGCAYCGAFTTVEELQAAAQEANDEALAAAKGCVAAENTRLMRELAEALSNRDRMARELDATEFPSCQDENSPTILNLASAERRVKELQGKLHDRGIVVFEEGKAAAAKPSPLPLFDANKEQVAEADGVLKVDLSDIAAARLISASEEMRALLNELQEVTRKRAEFLKLGFSRAIEEYNQRIAEIREALRYQGLEVVEDSSMVSGWRIVPFYSNSQEHGNE